MLNTPQIYVDIYQTRIPKYRELFFKRLIQLGMLDNITYKIIVSSDRQKKFNFESDMNLNIVEKKTRVLNLRGREFHFQLSSLTGSDADLVICEYGLKNFIVYWFLFIKKPKNFAFWGHGQTETKSSWKVEKFVRKKLLQRAKFFFAYTKACASKLMEIDYPKSRIQIVNNSIDTGALIEGIKVITDLQIKSFRNALGLEPSDIVLIYIGSLEKEKRLKFLLDAFQLISYKRPLAKLFIYSPDYFDSLKYRNKLKKVFVMGEADIDRKVRLALTSTALLNPGRVGLIAVDSFAMGVPIITTDWKFHAPEYSYLNNANSITTRDTLEEYVDGCLSLIDEAELRNKLVNGCKQSVDLFSIESMAKNFHLGVLKALENQNVR
jgi:glycosyltransferase involved in cell wall biosynthesis